MKSLEINFDRFLWNCINESVNNDLIINNKKELLQLLKMSPKNFARFKDWSLAKKSWNVIISIIYTSNPEGLYKLDDKIHFVLKITIDWKEFVYRSYRYLRHKFFTKDSCNLIHSRFRLWEYSKIIERLLKKAYLELKNDIYTDFESL